MQKLETKHLEEPEAMEAHIYIYIPTATPGSRHGLFWRGVSRVGLGVQASGLNLFYIGPSNHCCSSGSEGQEREEEREGGD